MVLPQTKTILINILQWLLNPLRHGITLWTLGGVPVFLPSGQLSGSPCRTQVLVIRDFATIMHSACVHVHMYMHTYALCGYARHLRPCRYAAILVNRPSGISQAAAIAANRTQGGNNHCSKKERPEQQNGRHILQKLFFVLFLNIGFGSPVSKFLNG